jgi:hypothetical protein
MDDCMTGAKSEKAAIAIQSQLIKLLSKAQINIRKFTSNSEKVLQSLPEELRETKTKYFGTQVKIILDSKLNMYVQLNPFF